MSTEETPKGWTPCGTGAPPSDVVRLWAGGGLYQRVFAAQFDHHPDGDRWVVNVGSGWGPLSQGWTPKYWAHLAPSEDTAEIDRLSALCGSKSRQLGYAVEQLEHAHRVVEQGRLLMVTVRNYLQKTPGIDATQDGRDLDISAFAFNQALYATDTGGEREAELSEPSVVIEEHSQHVKPYAVMILRSKDNRRLWERYDTFSAAEVGAAEAKVYLARKAMAPLCSRCDYRPPANNGLCEHCAALANAEPRP